MLSEISQTQTEKHCAVSLTCEINCVCVGGGWGLFFLPICPSTYPSMHPTTHPSSIDLSIHPPNHPSVIHLSSHISNCPSICSFVHPSIHFRYTENGTVVAHRCGRHKKVGKCRSKDPSYQVSRMNKPRNCVLNVRTKLIKLYCIGEFC